MLDKTITLYHKNENDKYERSTIHDCFYYVSDASSFSNTGMTISKSLTVIIRTDIDIEFSQGYDFIILSDIKDEITNSSEEAISLSIKEIKSKYKAYTINSVDKNLFGGLSNIELNCS